VITTETGGIGEAAGGHATIIPIDDPVAIARAIDEAVALPPEETRRRAERGREHALQFDRANVFDRMFSRVLPAPSPLAVRD
jgi:glycosyltransferase involved in cell wall biosynthesis